MFVDSGPLHLAGYRTPISPVSVLVSRRPGEGPMYPTRQAPDLRRFSGSECLGFS